MLQFRVILLLLVAGLAGCVKDAAWQAPHLGKDIGGDYGSTLLSIEIGDDGSVYQPEQLENLDSWLAAGSTKPLLVYVHGWHHNASSEDENYRSYKRFLADIEALAEQPVQGLYVGWRGDSVHIDGFPELIDFFTIWGRKSVSRTVGEHALGDLLASIRTNYGDRRVVVMGHSLGASALFHALKGDLDAAFEDKYEYILMNPAASDREFREVGQRLAMLNRTKAAARGLRRDYRKIFVLQSLGDLGVGLFYRLAFPFATPVGFSKERITHEAFICGEDKECREDKWICDIYLAGGRFAVEGVGETEERCREYLQRPIWVATGADSVSQDHNDLFNDIQGEAIASLIVMYLKAAI